MERASSKFNLTVKILKYLNYHLVIKAEIAVSLINLGPIVSKVNFLLNEII